MSDDLQVGSRLGRFQLVWELGRGGMASVWIALEKSRSGKQRLVALKAMLPKLARRPDFRSMFLDEGQIVRSIEHASVVQVYEVGENRGVLYMAMEWVEGDSLYALIRAAKQRRAIPPEQAVRIIADTAAGLHVAHELRGWDGELRGVVHCDVSPQNILVGLDGQTKLVDFGVAHAAAYSDEGSTERIAGKAGYMSPEQARGDPIDRRSDLFSLGIVLFELTTGERLFRGRDRAHTMHLVHIGEVPHPSTLYADYPKPLEEIVLKSLERDREQRFQTAEEFAQALDRYLVEQRVMVARASVGRLLRRVLGERIDARRHNIRLALKALKEGKAEELVSNGSGPRASELSLPSMSLSSTGVSQANLSATGTTASDLPSARARTGSVSSVSERDSYPSRGGMRASVAKIVAPAIVLAGGAGAYWWLQYRPPTVTRVTVTPASAASDPAHSEPRADETQQDPVATSGDQADAGSQQASARKRRPQPAKTGVGARRRGASSRRDQADKQPPEPDTGDKLAAADAGAKPSPTAEPAPDETGPKYGSGLKPTPTGTARPVTKPKPKPSLPPPDDEDLTNPYR
jgi:serine/threonine protein kinase